MSRTRRGRGVERERRARARRTNPPVGRPEATEASTRLVVALQEAGLTHLVGAARRLDFDEHWAPTGRGLVVLYRELVAAGALTLAEQVTAGRFDATPADNVRYYRSPDGVRDQKLVEALPPALRSHLENLLSEAAAGEERTRRRLVKELAAQLVADITPGDGADDTPPTPDQVHPRLRCLLGAETSWGVRMDTPAVIAAADVAARAGATQFEMDDRDTDRMFRVWAQVRGRRVEGVWAGTPTGAATAFVERLLTGGKCVGCGRLVSVDPAGGFAFTRTLIDGSTWSQDAQARVGVCVWVRHGLVWVRGCDPDPDSTGDG